MATNLPKLLFIDTNIWLDFYRARNEAYLGLLEKVESLGPSIIVTHQLETEYKANRQKVIVDSIAELKSPQPIPSIGVLAQAKQFKLVAKDIAKARKRVDALQKRLVKLIEKPNTDPVYKVCQRIFHKNDGLTLTRLDVDAELRKNIRERAERRFMHGCPPRKKGDVSYGDSINWEWMVECAFNGGADLVIVSRDTDYGVTLDKRSFINDHLRQEFSNRVSQKRKLLLFTKLSEALAIFHVPVTQAQASAEAELFDDPTPRMATADEFEVIPDDTVLPAFAAALRRPFIRRTRRVFPED